MQFILEDLKAAVESEAGDCLILYTSGTTGRPKGAVLTHANVIVQNVGHHVAAWGIDENDVLLATTPLAHRAGVGRLINALGLGGTLVLMEKFDAADALAAIERECVTVAGLPPTVIRMLLPSIKANPGRCASLRRVIVSTEAFPAHLVREVAALLPQVEFHGVYGMSEAAVSSANLAEQLERPGTVGRPLPDVEVRIDDGELLVRGRDVVMKGYFNRPEANAEAFRDGWFHTGDLARMDAEGYLYIVDRKKDMLVSGGYNVYSKEVEQVLGEHPDIADAAVVGVPDELYGEAVAAFVQARPGARLSAESVIEHCRGRLAGYKKPRHVVFVESLPRNSLGKVLKSELRRRGIGSA
jgi:long-chain acyl-CoA synthetase